MFYLKEIYDIMKQIQRTTGDFMFNDYQGTIDLEKVLKDEYNYKFDNDISNLYKQPFIELEGDGDDAMCWITYKNEKYLFKPLKHFHINVWGELLSEEINKYLEIPCAEYRAATLGSQSGVITKNILKKDETLILGSEIFQHFFNNYSYKTDKNNSIIDEKVFLKSYQIPKSVLSLNAYNQKRVIFNYLNNLEQVWAILEDNQYLKQDQISNIIKFLSAMLLSDIITIQADRHPNNWGIIKQENNHKPSLLFDNGISFGLGFPDIPQRIVNFRNELFNAKLLRDEERINRFIYEVRPNFTLSTDNVRNIEYRIKDTGPKVLEDFLNRSTIETQEKTSNIILNMEPNLLDTMIKTIEKKNMITMDDDVYLYISNIFKHNLNNLKKVVNQFWRSNSNEKSR